MTAATIRQGARIQIGSQLATTNRPVAVNVQAEKHGIFTVAMPNGLIAKVDYKDIKVEQLP